MSSNRPRNLGQWGGSIYLYTCMYLSICLSLSLSPSYVYIYTSSIYIIYYTCTGVFLSLSLFRSSCRCTPSTSRRCKRSRPKMEAWAGLGRVSLQPELLAALVLGEIGLIYLVRNGEEMGGLPKTCPSI